MNLFELAYMQMEREGIATENSWEEQFAGENEELLDRAVKIRHFLDMQARNKKVADTRWSKKRLAVV